jgi:hypothetical protein
MKSILGKFHLAIVLSALANAQTVYRDPAGAFTVQVAAGWQTQQQPGSPMVSFINEKAQASFSLGIIPGSSPTPTVAQELDHIQSQFPQSCPQAQVKQHGPNMIGGLTGGFLLVSCSNGQGGLEVMKFAVASKPGMLLIINTASPAANYDAVAPAFSSMERSVQFLQGATAAPTPAGNSAAGTYRDPQGRYSLAVPAGWSVTPPPDAGTGNVQLSSGPNWLMLLLSSGAQPGDINHQVTQQIQAQYTGFHLLNEGDFQVRGHPAHGSNATGMNPKGIRVSVLVMTISAGGGHFVTVVSNAPNEQAKEVNDTVTQVANSIRFAGE